VTVANEAEALALFDLVLANAEKWLLILPFLDGVTTTALMYWP
jgi:hypothetical protein